MNASDPTSPEVFGWVSPFPPAQTEIANYSRRVLDACRNHVTILPVPEPDGPGVEYSRALGRSLKVLQSGVTPIINVGNNYYKHSVALSVGSRFPNIAVFHDFHLQDVFLCEAAVEHKNWNIYKARMFKHYGDAGLAMAKCVSERTPIPMEELQDFPLVEVFAPKCLIAVTHNRLLCVDLERRLHAPAAYVPFPYDSINKSLRTRPGGDMPLRLVQFGYLGSNRCLREALEALKTYGRSALLRLDIYGHVAEREEIESVIRASQLEKQVQVHGYVDDNVLDDALANADLVINLRKPTKGEASASALRAFDARAAVVVSDVGWYGTLPDSVVFKIKPGDEVRGLQSLFDRALSDTQSLRSIGEAARHYLEREHSSRHMISALNDIQRSLPDLRRRWPFRSAVSRGIASADRIGLPAQFVAHRLFGWSGLFGGTA